MGYIVSATGCPQYNLGKWLTEDFKNVLNSQNSFCVMKLPEFIDSLKNICSQDDDILVSFEFYSLFQNNMID